MSPQCSEAKRLFSGELHNEQQHNQIIIASESGCSLTGGSKEKSPCQLCTPSESQWDHSNPQDNENPKCARAVLY
eukprot:scaffold115085_cov19-Prasinocladus_malaysianus.AAC.1